MDFGFLQGLREISASKKHPLGTLRVDQMTGCKYRYSKAGATALDPAKMGICVQDSDNHINIAVATSAAIGAQQVTVTLGATAATDDQYVDGFFVVNNDTGEGYAYRIDSNPAADASGSLTVTLAEPLHVAIVAGTTEVSLYPNLRNGITVSTTEENVPAGVPLVTVTAAYYYWAQTGGLGICWAGGTAGVGSWLTLDASSAGQLIKLSETIATTIAQPNVGYVAYGAQVDTEYKPVFFTID